MSFPLSDAILFASDDEGDTDDQPRTTQRIARLGQGGVSRQPLREGVPVQQRKGEGGPGVNELRERLQNVMRAIDATLGEPVPDTAFLSVTPTHATAAAEAARPIFPTRGIDVDAMVNSILQGGDSTTTQTETAAAAETTHSSLFSPYSPWRSTAYQPSAQDPGFDRADTVLADLARRREALADLSSFRMAASPATSSAAQGDLGAKPFENTSTHHRTTSHSPIFLGADHRQDAASRARREAVQPWFHSAPPQRPAASTQHNAASSSASSIPNAVFQSAASHAPTYRHGEAPTGNDLPLEPAGGSGRYPFAAMSTAAADGGVDSPTRVESDMARRRRLMAKEGEESERLIALLARRREEDIAAMLETRRTHVGATVPTLAWHSGSPSHAEEPAVSMLKEASKGNEESSRAPLALSVSSSAPSGKGEERTAASHSHGPTTPPPPTPTAMRGWVTRPKRTGDSPQQVPRRPAPKLELHPQPENGVERRDAKLAIASSLTSSVTSCASSVTALAPGPATLTSSQGQGPEPGSPEPIDDTSRAVMAALRQLGLGARTIEQVVKTIAQGHDTSAPGRASPSRGPAAAWSTPLPKRGAPQARPLETRSADENSELAVPTPDPFTFSPHKKAPVAAAESPETPQVQGCRTLGETGRLPSFPVRSTSATGTVPRGMEDSAAFPSVSMPTVLSVTSRDGTAPSPQHPQERSEVGQLPSRQCIGKHDDEDRSHSGTPERGEEDDGPGDAPLPYDPSEHTAMPPPPLSEPAAHGAPAESHSALSQGEGNGDANGATMTKWGGKEDEEGEEDEEVPVDVVQWVDHHSGYDKLDEGPTAPPPLPPRISEEAASPPAKQPPAPHRSVPARTDFETQEQDDTASPSAARDPEYDILSSPMERSATTPEVVPPSISPERMAAIRSERLHVSPTRLRSRSGAARASPRPTAESQRGDSPATPREPWRDKLKALLSGSSGRHATAPPPSESSASSASSPSSSSIDSLVLSSSSSSSRDQGRRRDAATAAALDAELKNVFESNRNTMFAWRGEKTRHNGNYPSSPRQEGVGDGANSDGLRTPLRPLRTVSVPRERRPRWHNDKAPQPPRSEKSSTSTGAVQRAMVAQTTALQAMRLLQQRGVPVDVQLQGQKIPAHVTLSTDGKELLFRIEKLQTTGRPVSPTPPPVGASSTESGGPRKSSLAVPKTTETSTRLYDSGVFSGRGRRSAAVPPPSRTFTESIHKPPGPRSLSAPPAPSPASSVRWGPMDDPPPAHRLPKGIQSPSARPAFSRENSALLASPQTTSPNLSRRDSLATSVSGRFVPIKAGGSDGRVLWLDVDNPRFSQRRVGPASSLRAPLAQTPPRHPSVTGTRVAAASPTAGMSPQRSHATSQSVPAYARGRIASMHMMRSPPRPAPPPPPPPRGNVARPSDSFYLREQEQYPRTFRPPPPGPQKQQLMPVAVGGVVRKAPRPASPAAAFTKAPAAQPPQVMSGRPQAPPGILVMKKAPAMKMAPLAAPYASTGQRPVGQLRVPPQRPSLVATATPPPPTTPRGGSSCVAQQHQRLGITQPPPPAATALPGPNRHPSPAASQRVSRPRTISAPPVMQRAASPAAQKHAAAPSASASHVLVRPPFVTAPPVVRGPSIDGLVASAVPSGAAARAQRTAHKQVFGLSRDGRVVPLVPASMTVQPSSATTTGALAKPSRVKELHHFPLRHARAFFPRGVMGYEAEHPHEGCGPGTWEDVAGVLCGPAAFEVLRRHRCPVFASVTGPTYHPYRLYYIIPAYKRLDSPKDAVLLVLDFRTRQDFITFLIGVQAAGPGEVLSYGRALWMLAVQRIQRARALAGLNPFDMADQYRSKDDPRAAGRDQASTLSSPRKRKSPSPASREDADKHRSRSPWFHFSHRHQHKEEDATSETDVPHRSGRRKHRTRHSSSSSSPSRRSNSSSSSDDRKYEKHANRKRQDHPRRIHSRPSHTTPAAVAAASARRQEHTLLTLVDPVDEESSSASFRGTSHTPGTPGWHQDDTKAFLVAACGGGDPLTTNAEACGVARTYHVPPALLTAGMNGDGEASSAASERGVLSILSTSYDRRQVTPTTAREAGRRGAKDVVMPLSARPPLSPVRGRTPQAETPVAEAANTDVRHGGKEEEERGDHQNQRGGSNRFGIWTKITHHRRASPRKSHAVEEAAAAAPGTGDGEAEGEEIRQESRGRRFKLPFFHPPKP